MAENEDWITVEDFAKSYASCPDDCLKMLMKYEIQIRQKGKIWWVDLNSWKSFKNKNKKTKTAEDRLRDFENIDD